MPACTKASNLRQMMRQKWREEDSLTTWSIAATYPLERADSEEKER